MITMPLTRPGIPALLHLLVRGQDRVVEAGAAGDRLGDRRQPWQQLLALARTAARSGRAACQSRSPSSCGREDPQADRPRVVEQPEAAPGRLDRDLAAGRAAGRRHRRGSSSRRRRARRAAGRAPSAAVQVDSTLSTAAGSGSVRGGARAGRRAARRREARAGAAVRRRAGRPRPAGRGTRRRLSVTFTALRGGRLVAVEPGRRCTGSPAGSERVVQVQRGQRHRRLRRVVRDDRLLGQRRRAQARRQRRRCRWRAGTARAGRPRSAERPAARLRSARCRLLPLGSADGFAATDSASRPDRPVESRVGSTMPGRSRLSEVICVSRLRPGQLRRRPADGRGDRFRHRQHDRAAAPPMAPPGHPGPARRRFSRCSQVLRVGDPHVRARVRHRPPARRRAAWPGAARRWQRRRRPGRPR